MTTLEEPEDGDDGTTPTWSEGLGRSNPLLDLDADVIRGFRKILDSMPTQSEPPDPETTTRLGALGPFRDLEEIGRGGMGVVYRARDPVSGDDVAVKIQTPGLARIPGARSRFHREARLVAGLNHPGIVPHRTSGEEDGRCYLVSDYCPGLDMETWLRGRSFPAPPREAARIVRCVADAVAYSHEQGVLHRDLKPSNVLLAGAGPKTDSEEIRPRLIDFGLAKAMDEGDSPIQQATATGLVLGTPPYMSPEQVLGRRGEVDVRTDVYGLGTILYELLTKQPPFRGENPLETLRMVVSDYPVPVRVLRPGVPKALETITLQCLEKSRACRYQSAVELRDDLDRFLEGRPILARPIGPVERLRRWSRMRPTASAVTVLLALVFIAAACGVAGWLHTLRVERDRLEQHNYASSLQLARRALTEGRNGRAQEILRGLVPAPGEVDRREFAWHYLWNEARREAKLLPGNVTPLTWAAIDPAGCRLAGSDGNDSQWVYDLDQERTVWSARLVDRQMGARPVFSPDGRYLASLLIGKEGAGRGVYMVEVRQAESGKLLWSRPVPFDRKVACLRFLESDGLTLVLAPQALGTKIRPVVAVWGCRPGLTDASEPVEVAEWHATSADGRFVAATTSRGQLAVLFVASGTWLPLSVEVPAAGVDRVTFTQDGKRLAVVRSDGHELLIFEIPTGTLHRRIGELSTAIAEFELQPNGETVLIRGPEQEVHLINPVDDTDVLIFGPSAQSGVETKRMAFSSDGEYFLIHRAEYNLSDHIEVRSSSKGTRLGESPGRHLGRAGDWIVRHTGRGELIYGLRREVWMWDWSRAVDPERGDVLRAHGDEVWTATFSKEGSIFATTSNHDYESMTIKVWDASGRRLIRAWSDVDGTVSDLAFAPDATWFATSHLLDCKALRIRRIEGDEVTTVELPDGEWGRAVDVDPRGTRVYVVGDRGTILAWDVAEQRPAWEVRAPARLREDGPRERLHELSVAPDGGRLAVAGELGEVRIYNAATGRLLSTFRGPTPMFAVAYSPDGRTLAAADKEGAIYILDAGTAAVIRILPSDDCDLKGLAYSPDGRTLAAGGVGKIVRLWDPETGEELLTLAKHEAQINSVAFSPDGRTLATADHRGVVLFWRGIPETPPPSRSPRPYYQVVEHPLVIERTQADLPPREGLVVGGHDGLLEVVEVELHQPRAGVAD